MKFRTILHATDFSESSARAFAVACALAEGPDARLILLHVTPPMIPTVGQVVTPPMPEIQERLSESLKQLRPTDPSVRVEHLLEEAVDPGQAILDVARRTNCDLIVLGTHGRTGFLDRLLMGSVAEKVVREATCPVVTVKAPAQPTAN